MNVYVSLEHRFYEYQDNLYTDGAFDEKFWNRYLAVFSRVTIVARVKKLSILDPKLIKVNNEKIKYHSLPYYLGLKQTLLNTFKVKAKLKEITLDKRSAFVLRVGSPIADSLAPMLRAQSIEYAVEVVGDPWDVFAPGAFKSYLRPFMRLYFSWRLKIQCKDAMFSSYVTEFALQTRYPSINAVKSIHASSIELREDFFFEKNSINTENKKWIFVGTLEQYQKAPDVLIKAFNLIKDKSISLTIIGDGRMKQELESICTNSNVKFLGKLKNSALVRSHLIEHDFFVLPSRGEGLPRAMIEAMACSCVCVGSDIGGIKELISDDFIVKAGSVDELFNKIEYVSNMKNELLNENRSKNYNKAKNYLIDKLEKRRTNLYQSIKDKAQSR